MSLETAKLYSQYCGPIGHNWPRIIKTPILIEFPDHENPYYNGVSFMRLSLYVLYYVGFWQNGGPIERQIWCFWKNLIQTVPLLS